MALLVTVRKAVQPHTCDTCGLYIPSGKHYIRLFYTRDEGGTALRTFKECGSCAVYTGRAARLKAVASGAVKPKLRIRKKAKKAALATGGIVTGRPQTVNASALIGLTKAQPASAVAAVAAGLTAMGQAAKIVSDGMPAAAAAAGRAQQAISAAQAARQRALGQSA